MKTVQYVEFVRRSANIPTPSICDALGIDSEERYNKFLVNGHLSVFDKIMLFTVFEHYPAAIPMFITAIDSGN